MIPLPQEAIAKLIPLPQEAIAKLILLRQEDIAKLILLRQEAIAKLILLPQEAIAKLILLLQVVTSFIRPGITGQSIKLQCILKHIHLPHANPPSYFNDKGRSVCLWF